MIQRLQNRAKVVAIFLAGLAVSAIAILLPTQPVSAERDEPLSQIALYRTWTKVTQEPIKGPGIPDLAAITVASAGGG